MFDSLRGSIRTGVLSVSDYSILLMKWDPIFNQTASIFDQNPILSKSHFTAKNSKLFFVLPCVVAHRAAPSGGRAVCLDAFHF